MEIGAKIKHARVQAGVTQEQTAEALGVSRQTVSNWENEKTYPDIVSVIKMSDLYAVSLDHLLKEEPTVKETYMAFLDESTNTVKSRSAFTKVILLSVYLGIWALAMLTFWVMMSPSDAGGFSLIFLWILLPVTSFVISVMIAKRRLFGRATPAFSLFFGVMYMLAEYATFSAANMVTFQKFNMPNFGMLGVGIAISLLGMLIGFSARKIGLKRDEKKHTGA